MEDPINVFPNKISSSTLKRGSSSKRTFLLKEKRESIVWNMIHFEMWFFVKENIKEALIDYLMGTLWLWWFFIYLSLNGENGTFVYIIAPKFNIKKQIKRMKSKAFCDIKFWVPNLSFNSSFPQLSWPLICIIIKSYMDLMDCVLTKENWAVIGMYSEKSQTCTKRNYSFGP